MKRFVLPLLLLLVGAGGPPQRTPLPPPGTGTMAPGGGPRQPGVQSFFFSFPGIPEARPFEAAQYPGQLGGIRLTIRADFLHQLVASIHGQWGTVQGSGQISQGVALGPELLVATTAQFSPGVSGPTGTYTVLTVVSTTQPGAVSPSLLDLFEGTGTVTLQALIGDSGWSWACNGSCTAHSSAQGSMTFTLEYVPE